MFPSNITNGTAKCITIITTCSILPHRKHIHFLWSNILYSKTEDHNHNAEKDKLGEKRPMKDQGVFLIARSTLALQVVCI